MYTNRVDEDGGVRRGAVTPVTVELELHGVSDPLLQTRAGGYHVVPRTYNTNTPLHHLITCSDNSYCINGKCQTSCMILLLSNRMSIVDWQKAFRIYIW